MILARTPAVLRALLQDLPDTLVRANEGEGTFSPFDVVGHLIHGERTDWIPRARILLEEGGGRPFEPFDRFAMYEAGRGRTLAELLDEFEALRAANLRTLDGWRLTDADLARRGTHPDLGPVTLGELLAAWAVHDLDHLAQIARVLAFQSRERVGPWRAYLPILPR